MSEEGEGGQGREREREREGVSYLKQLTCAYIHTRIHSRLSVLSKYHKLYAIKASSLKVLLQKIKENKAHLPKTLSPEALMSTKDKSMGWVSED